MADAAQRLGTLWEELCALPSNQVGEIVGGEVFASPRPAGPQSRVTSKLGGRLDGPFDAGEGGPGGWIILDEPELHLGRRGIGARSGWLAPRANVTRS